MSDKGSDAKGFSLVVTNWRPLKKEPKPNFWQCHENRREKKWKRKKREYESEGEMCLQRKVLLPPSPAFSAMKGFKRASPEKLCQKNCDRKKGWQPFCIMGHTVMGVPQCRTQTEASRNLKPRSGPECTWADPRIRAREIGGTSVCGISASLTRVHSSSTLVLHQSTKSPQKGVWSH